MNKQLFWDSISLSPWNDCNKHTWSLPPSGINCIMSFTIDKPTGEELKSYITMKCNLEKLPQDVSVPCILQFNCDFFKDSKQTDLIRTEKVTMQVKTIPSDLNLRFEHTRWCEEVDSNLICIRIKVSLAQRNSLAGVRASRIPFHGIIRNHNTCYINVIIQMLFHIPAFRRIVISIDKDSLPDKYRRLPELLQKIFWEMNQLPVDRSPPKPVNIDSILSVFNIGENRAIEMDDTHSFYLQILSMLKDCGCKQEIDDLFSFRQKIAVKSKDGEILSEIVEDTNFLPLLLIDNKSSDQDSPLDFNSFLASDRNEEINDGKSHKLTTFLTLPKLLVIQVNLPVEGSTNEKSIPKIEVPQTLSLDKYTEIKEHGDYSLYCVILHTGSYNAGHFYAALRPSFRNFWVIFNNEIVTLESNISTILRPDAKTRVFPYLLIYVNKEYEKILGKPIELKEFPKYLREKIPPLCRKVTIKLRNAVLIARELEELNLETKNATYLEKGLGQNCCSSIEMETIRTLHNLYQRVADILKMNGTERLRLWCRSPQSLLGSIIENTSDKFVGDLPNFEIFADLMDAQEEHLIQSHHTRLFMVLYDPDEVRFHFITTITVSKKEKIQTLWPIISLLINPQFLSSDSFFDDTQNTKINTKSQGCVLEKSAIEKSNEYLMYVYDLQNPPKLLPSDKEFSPSTFKNGYYLFFVKKSSKVYSFNPEVKEPFMPEMFFEDARAMTLPAFYELKFCTSTIRMRSFDGKTDISLAVSYTCPVRCFYELLAAAAHLKVDKEDAVLLFPVEEAQIPSERPIDVTKAERFMNYLKSCGQLYFAVFSGMRQILFSQSKSYSSVRVTIAENAALVTRRHHLILKIPFTPYDVIQTINLQLSPIRVRRVVSNSKSINISLDSLIYDTHVRLRFEPDPGEVPEITVITGTPTPMGNNYRYYGEPFSFPVLPDDTFDSIVERITQLFDSQSLECYCFDGETYTEDETFKRGSTELITEAAKLGRKISVINNNPE